MSRARPNRPDHDLRPGPITRCQVCASEDLEVVIDLGHQPLCDSLLSAEQLGQPEMTYPLRQLRCPDCTLSQIDYAVESDVVFHRQYPYRTGVTRELAAYLDGTAASVIADCGLTKGSLVVDIGSNDGTLLSAFKARGMRVLGVEPTNIAKFANESGIETIQSFFSEDLARQVVREWGRPSVVTATNVFAHVAALGEFIRGIEALLVPGGVFVLENHYLLEILRRTQYDTIYHEHLRSYSLKSLITLFDYYDFTVRDAQPVSRYGGSIRVFVARGRGQAVRSSVAALLAEEERFGLSHPEVYVAFRERVQKSKRDLLGLAWRAAEQGERFVGNSCPGRSSTLLNYCGIDGELMPYIAEQPASLKLGLYLPGKHIPIVESRILVEEQPDYVVLLAWHYSESISRQLRERGLRSKLVVPLPEVRILNV